MTYSAPGVYVEEISTLPQSVAQVATSIPAFIGATERGNGTVKRITSLLEFTETFGGPQPESLTVDIAPNAGPGGAAYTVSRAPGQSFDILSYYAMAHFYANGGGPCWFISVGDHSAQPTKAMFEAGLAKLAEEDEPTLIVFLDADGLPIADYADLCDQATAQCKRLMDRFLITDVPGGNVQAFRDRGIGNLDYAAAYHPYLRTTLVRRYGDDGNVTVTDGTGVRFALATPAGGNGIEISFTAPTQPASTPRAIIRGGAAAVIFNVTGDGTVLEIGNTANKTGQQIAAAWATRVAADPASAQGFDIQAVGTGAANIPRANAPGTNLTTTQSNTTRTLADLKATDTAHYNAIKELLGQRRVTLPPSPAMAGVYTRVDAARGVWKAPANVTVSSVIEPVTKITDAVQAGLNIDPTAGKSINAIRAFAGKGTLVWGARTLLGNDREFRYVPVRRLFITIEESTKKASAFAVFEPNNASTWLKVKGMIEAYLFGLWEQGALAGAKPEDAYKVSVGLGQTMTQQDVLEGRLIVQIGIAAVRPAEFIILRFMHELQKS